MIDAWLAVCFNILVFTMGFHTYLAYIISRSKITSLTLTNMILVKPTNDDLKEDYSKLDSEKKLRIRAVWINTIAKVVFLGFLTFFNIIFWATALLEHMRSPEDYISQL